ncbi:MAG TPA: DinB family protein [Candidatus Sulfotelmatobacter sp.]|nr:DinB family protein [Candidatus Sulfotelmatobacter sp.]
MDKEEISTLYDYNEWANRRVLDRAERLPAAQVRAAAPVSHGSLLGSLAHVLAAEWMWRTRCQGGVSPQALLSADDFPTLASLRQRWEGEMVAMRRYVTELDESRFRERIRYTNTKGARFETPLWQILLHVVNHGTQYRAEAAVLLTQAGASPGDLDLIAYLRQGSGSALKPP